MQKMKLIYKLILPVGVAFFIVGVVSFYLLSIEINNIENDRAKTLNADFILRQAEKDLTREDFVSDASQNEQSDFFRFNADVKESNIIRIKIWNKDNKIIYSDVATDIGGVFTDNAELARALKGETIANAEDADDLTAKYSNTESFSNENTMELYVPVKLENQDEIVGVAETYINMDSVAQKIWQVQIFLIISLCLSLVLVLSVLIYVVKRFIDKPMNSFMRTIEKVASGDLNQKVFVESQDECGILAKEFNVMIGKIRESNSVLAKEKIKTEIAKTRLDFATKSAKIGVWDWNIVKNNFVWDDNMFRLYGINRNADTVAYDFWQNSLHPDDMKEAVAFLNDAVAGKREYSTKYRIIWPDKSLHNIRAYGMVIKDKKGSPIHMIGINFDITKDYLVDKAKTEFVSLASHQLRTPLSAISWYTEMLLAGDAGKLKKEQISYLKEIYHGNQRMVELVNSLLNVSRLELGTFMIEPVECDLHKLAEEIIEEVTPRLKEKAQVFKKSFEDLPLLMLDKKLTNMVLENLLTNSIKYTPEKGKISLSIKKNDPNVEIIVSDTGMGIPLEQQDRIFTKLFRADNARATDTDGTGLGLYLVKSIIEHVGGKIWFESQENKGTTFHVTFPLSGMKKKEGNKSLE